MYDKFNWSRDETKQNLKIVQLFMFDYFRNVHVNEDNEYQRNSTKLTDYPISVYFGNSFIVSKCIFLLNIEFYFAEITMNGEGVEMQWSASSTLVAVCSVSA